METKIIDGFFSNFEAIRKLADTAHYQDEVYPADNTVYPGICKDLPAGLHGSLRKKLSGLGFTHIRPALTFLRMSVPAGNKAPHYVHTDLLAGRWTLLVYLQDPPDGVNAGTGFYRHIETGMDRHPTNQEQVDIWVDEQRDMSKWELTDFVEMKANRAIVFDSSLMHCALPTGGFGVAPSDGRVVLTLFFNAERAWK